MQDKHTAKRSLDKPDSDSCSKRICLDERGTPPQNYDGGCVITGASGPNIYYVYNPGNATIERYWCGLLNLQYVRAMRPRLGSPITPLTPPTRTVRIPGDGNCLFSALSYIITGTIDQQAAVHAVILNHMSAIEGRLRRGFFPPCYTDSQSYIEGTRMNRDRTWGSDCEMITMADLLNTTIYSHDTANNVWAPYTPAGGIDPTVPALYLQWQPF